MNKAYLSLLDDALLNDKWTNEKLFTTNNFYNWKQSETRKISSKKVCFKFYHDASRLLFYDVRIEIDQRTTKFNIFKWSQQDKMLTKLKKQL